MGQENNIFGGIYNRLLGLGIRSQVHLGEILGITGAAVWKAKKENRFPEKWISILCQFYDVAPEWLLGIEVERKTPDISPEISLIKTLVQDVGVLTKKFDSLEREMSSLKELVMGNESLYQFKEKKKAPY